MTWASLPSSSHIPLELDLGSRLQSQIFPGSSSLHQTVYLCLLARAMMLIPNHRCLNSTTSRSSLIASEKITSLEVLHAVELGPQSRYEKAH